MIPLIFVRKQYLWAILMPIHLDGGIGKSTGPDGIRAEFLRQINPVVLKRLLDLYNLTRSSEASWGRAYILRITKKDKPTADSNSSIPFSLTSIIAKVMERIVNETINFFLEKLNRLLFVALTSFRKHQSTTQHVTRLEKGIKDALYKKQTLIAVFVYFKAAYDSIWRAKLYHEIDARHWLWWKAIIVSEVIYQTNFLQCAMELVKQTHRGL